MKILMYTDPHWSQYSSILRSRGRLYSQRLENLIASINWAERLSELMGCDMVICLGDFFDSSVLNSEELTALQDVEWNRGIRHIFIVGNHESNMSTLEYSSTQALNKEGFAIVDIPTELSVAEDTVLYFLPYILEENRKTLNEYIKKLGGDNPRIKKKIVLSHNDILGIRYGKFESKEGFDLKEIESSCDLYVNGHLHNCCFLNDKETILNLGNLTGQNFSEDATRYSHYACILDTDTMQLSFHENPNAFNFYKLEISTVDDIAKLYELKTNAAVTIQCKEDLLENVRQIIPTINNIVEHRLIVYRDIVTTDTQDVTEVSLKGMDYLEKFSDFILQNVGNTDVIKEELTHISGGIK